MNAGNLYHGLPQQAAQEQFDPLLERPGLRLERIVSSGQATPAGQWYDQAEDEWVVLLQGEAGLRIEGEAECRRLRPGDWLLLPAHCRHRVEWTAAEGASVWLALHLEASGEDSWTATG